MKINYNSDNKYVFYESEIKRALDWLYKIRDDEQNGWAWVQFIRPNEQNTAEVICAYAENEDWLIQNPKAVSKLVQSIEYWLLDTSHAKISIDFCWVLRALQKLRNCKTLYDLLPHDKLENAVKQCLDWLCENYYQDTGDGWGDNSGEISSVIRTSLAIICLNTEVAYLRASGHDDNHIKQYEQLLDKSTRWLLGTQNSDGGWGNLDEKLITAAYQKTHAFSFEELKYQCNSNAASTGYAMLALCSDDSRKHTSALKSAAAYLKKTQNEAGAWNVFTEIGIRDGERYTFRHFGTAWALQGIIVSGMGDYRDECVIHGFEYLTTLQDDNYGGWRSSPDADNYTWATCNALSTIHLLKRDLAQVHADRFLSVVWDWWSLKKKDANFSFNIGKTTLAFNGATALAFCLTFSVMISLLLFVGLGAIGPLFDAAHETMRKFVYSVLTVLAAVILGLPWIVYVKNIFKHDDEGWIDSIGWVYGIITGFVLVLYQFII